MNVFNSFYLKIYLAMSQGGSFDMFKTTHLISYMELKHLDTFYYCVYFSYQKNNKAKNKQKIYIAHDKLVKKNLCHGFLPLPSDTLFCVLENTVFKKIYITDSAYSNYSGYSALQCNPRQVNYTKYLGGIPFCTAHL